MREQPSSWLTNNGQQRLETCRICGLTVSTGARAACLSCVLQGVRELQLKGKYYRAQMLTVHEVPDSTQLCADGVQGCVDLCQMLCHICATRIENEHRPF